MAEGWKQVWEDFIGALRGDKIPAEAPEPPEPEPPPPWPTPPASAVPAPAPENALAPDSTASDAAPAEGAAAAGAPAPAPVELTPRQIWIERLRTGGFYVLLAILFAGGLWFSGGDKYWAQWTAPKPPAPDVVATFDGGQITTADLEEHFKLLVPEEYRAQIRSLDSLRLVVREMVADELARRWAAAQKVDADQNFRHTMEHITEDINLDSFNTNLHAGGIPVAESEIQNYYEANRAQFGEQKLDAVREKIRQLLASQKEGDYLRQYIDSLKNSASVTRNFELLDVPPPSTADLQDYYTANPQTFAVPAQFTVDLLAIRVGADEAAARAAADKALTKLRSGADLTAIPAEVPEAQVITATTVAGGTLGAEWDTAVGALQPGELSNVIRAGEAFYIARLIESQPARAQTFDEARAKAQAAVQARQTEAWMQANGSKTLFTLKGKQYTLSQFYTEYKELAPEVQMQYGGAEGMKKLAERLIERLVLVEDTYDQLLQVKNKDLIDQTRLDVLKQMMDQQEVDDKIQVSEEDARQYYEQHPEQMALPPQVRIRYIRVGLGQTADEQKAARARADEAYRKLVPGLLQKGVDFADIAKAYSEDPETAANGGEFPGWLGETGNPFEPPELHELHQIVLRLNVNDITPPFELGDSIYIVQSIERREPQALSFAEAKPYIEQLLKAQQHDQLLLELEARLTKQVNLVIYDRTLETYVKQSAVGSANSVGSSNSP